MHKYTIVSFLNDQPDGSEFSASEWPLHITLADDFMIDHNETKAEEQLRDFLANRKPITAVAGRDDNLGKHLEVPVALIDTNTELIRLHSDLVDSLKFAGAVFYNPHYIKGGYLPHVTMQKNGRVHEGNLINIDNLSVVDMRPGGDESRRKILVTIQFGGSA